MTALESTARTIVHALHQGIFAEQLSGRSGFLQSVDPRVKVIAFTEFLISISLSRNPWVIVAIYLLALALAWRSSISPGLLLRRVWLAMPFFTIPIALPALFITPGPTQVQLPFGLSITQTGVAAATLLLLRVSASLTFTLLLIYTTAWNTLLSALTALGLPEAFALILGMTHRYIYLLLRIANDMLVSRRSRVVGRLPTAEGQRLLAAAAGTLLERSLKLSGEVYLAMQSRGFRGATVSLQYSPVPPGDWALLLGLSLVAAASIWFGR